MATARKDENLTNRQIQAVAAEISATNMKILAQDYLSLPMETVEELFDENKRDAEGFNRAVITRWRNMNSEDQVEVSTLLSVADPGFPRRRRANPSEVDENLLFGKIFAENYMKINEIGQSERVYLDPPMIIFF